MTFGHSYYIDLTYCDLDKISSIRNVANYYVELLTVLNMINHKFIIDRYGNNKDVFGISFVGLIDQSSITGHFVESDEDNPKAYIDIFTCSELDKPKCVEITKLFFATDKTKIRTQYHLR